MHAPRPVDVRLRAATRSDAGLVLAFVRELADYERLGHEVVAEEAVLADHLFGERASAEALIAEVDGEPAGLALFFHNFSTFAGRRGLYLEDLYVRPAFRQLGIGTRLMAELACIALDRDCARFEWSVLDWNTPAIEFYRRIGAIGMAEWTVQRVTGDALVALAGRGDVHWG